MPGELKFLHSERKRKEKKRKEKKRKEKKERPCFFFDLQKRKKWASGVGKRKKKGGGEISQVEEKKGEK